MKQVGHLKRVYGEMCKVDRDWEIFKDMDMDIIVITTKYPRHLIHTTRNHRR